MNLIEGADYFVRLVDLPLEIAGMVTPNNDGTFSIYLNARTSRKRQKEACDHEIRHIKNDDFYNGKPISEVEQL